MRTLGLGRRVVRRKTTVDGGAVLSLLRVEIVLGVIVSVDRVVDVPREVVLFVYVARMEAAVVVLREGGMEAVAVV